MRAGVPLRLYEREGDCMSTICSRLYFALLLLLRAEVKSVRFSWVDHGNGRTGVVMLTSFIEHSCGGTGCLKGAM